LLLVFEAAGEDAGGMETLRLGKWTSLPDVVRMHRVEGLKLTEIQNAYMARA